MTQNVIKKIKKLNGVALRDSRDKSVLVEIKILKMHPLYQKRYFSNRKILAHTEVNVSKGQTVAIVEIKPISRRKAWQVKEVK